MPSSIPQNALRRCVPNATDRWTAPRKHEEKVIKKSNDIYKWLQAIDSWKGDIEKLSL
jgi:hypothetical protein